MAFVGVWPAAAPRLQPVPSTFDRLHSTKPDSACPPTLTTMTTAATALGIAIVAVPSLVRKRTVAPRGGDGTRRGGCTVVCCRSASTSDVIDTRQEVRKLLLALSGDDYFPELDSSEFESVDPGREQLDRFYVVGSWTGWDFAELQSATAQESAVLSLEFTLTEDGGDFQIVQNKDWDLVLYPGSADQDDFGSGEADGPDDGGHGRNWQLDGKAGDVFRLEMQPPSTGRPAIVSWRCTRRLSNAFGSSNPSSLDDDLDMSSSRHESQQYDSDWEAALANLADEKRYGLRDDSFNSAHSVAIRACGAAGAWQQGLQLLEDVWHKDKQSFEPSASDYEAIARGCDLAGEEARAADLRSEVKDWNSQGSERYSLTPRVWWNRDVRRMGCGVRNALDWHGGEPLPMAPRPGMWMLPASDKIAVEIARKQDDLRSLGWKLLTSEDYKVVQRLDDKYEFQDYGESLGLGHLFPKLFKNPEEASYPCILKPASGEFGKGVRIVHSADEVFRETRCDTELLPPHWLLQELASGCYEYSTSMLVLQGKILETACMRYHYDADEYVWPNVKELGKELRSDEPTAEQFQLMERFLEGYSGLCNFNYKIRKDTGEMCIFEMNLRVGADLACDVPRQRARQMLERMDSL